VPNGLDVLESVNDTFILLYRKQVKTTLQRAPARAYRIVAIHPRDFAAKVLVSQQPRDSPLALRHAVLALGLRRFLLGLERSHLVQHFEKDRIAPGARFDGAPIPFNG
jgi:hypothetical protein